MGAATPYVLDANIFIEAKSGYYAFTLCPGFWDSLLGHFEAGNLCSIDHIKRELTLGRDDLAAWVEQTVPSEFFHSTQAQDIGAQYQEIMVWVQRSSQFFDLAKAQFAASADGWLVAYAKVQGHVVVTREQPAPAAKNRVRIPDVCMQFGVAYVDTFQMLKELNVRFDWDKSL